MVNTFADYIQIVSDIGLVVLTRHDCIIEKDDLTSNLVDVIVD